MGWHTEIPIWFRGLAMMSIGFTVTTLILTLGHWIRGDY